MNPYEILGVAPNADDEAVRKAYLDLVRRFSPDRYPEKFKRISNAYETLKDEKSRLRYYLFDTGIPGDTPFQTFLRDVSAMEKRKPMSHEQMKEFLRKCMKK